jgi:TolA-binding protein
VSAPKATDKPGFEDLSVRARRIGLSPDEQRLLDRACEGSPTLRVAHQVGCDFDRVDTVQAGDEELIARVADRVLRRPDASTGRVRRRLAWGFGIAAALVSSASAAWWTGVVRRQVATGTVVVASVAPAAAPRAEAPRAPPQVTPADTDEALSTTPATRREPRVASSPLATRVASSRETPNGAEGSGAGKADGDTPASWFRRANAARRAGDLVVARGLYGELESRFPGSGEARLSHVSLGKLLLASGNAPEAERQFSWYLSSGSGELAEEALVGQAESLDRLGRHEEERKCWERLLRDFPGSVYAAQAKSRIDKLPPPDP